MFHVTGNTILFGVLGVVRHPDRKGSPVVKLSYQQNSLMVSIGLGRLRRHVKLLLVLRKLIRESGPSRHLEPGRATGIHSPKCGELPRFVYMSGLELSEVAYWSYCTVRPSQVLQREPRA